MSFQVFWPRWTTRSRPVGQYETEASIPSCARSKSSNVSRVNPGRGQTRLRFPQGNQDFRAGSRPQESQRLSGSMFPVPEADRGQPIFQRSGNRESAQTSGGEPSPREVRSGKKTPRPLPPAALPAPVQSSDPDAPGSPSLMTLPAPHGELTARFQCVRAFRDATRRAQRGPEATPASLFGRICRSPELNPVRHGKSFKNARRGPVLQVLRDCLAAFFPDCRTTRRS